MASKQYVLLPGDPEWSSRLVEPQHVVVLVGDLGHVGPHGGVPRVVAGGVGAHVDDGRVLRQRFPQVTGQTGHEPLQICVATCT